MTDRTFLTDEVGPRINSGRETEPSLVPVSGREGRSGLEASGVVTNAARGAKETLFRSEAAGSKSASDHLTSRDPAVATRAFVQPVLRANEPLLFGQVAPSWDDEEEEAHGRKAVSTTQSQGWGGEKGDASHQ